MYTELNWAVVWLGILIILILFYIILRVSSKLNRVKTLPELPEKKDEVIQIGE